jgi:hypothetical protein
MAFINTIPAREATGAALEMYERQANHWGYVPNYSKVFSHRPEVMARWGRMLAEIRRPVDDRRFELVTFVAALELRHSACSLAHGEQLAGMIGDDAVMAIADGNEADVLPADEVAIVGFARAIARDARKITSGQVEALKSVHGLRDDDIFDIAAIAAGRSFLTKILDALGSEPDSSFMAMSDDLRRRLTVGRPISCQKPEYVEQQVLSKTA